MAYTTSIKLIDAATADVAAADALVVETGDRQKMSIQFIASGISAGNGVFSVEVSNDGVNFITYNRLTTNVTNTNGQTDTRVASITLNSNTSAFAFFPPGDHFRYLRVPLNMTTDGTYTAILHSMVPGA